MFILKVQTDMSPEDAIVSCSVDDVLEPTSLYSHRTPEQIEEKICSDIADVVLGFGLQPHNVEAQVTMTNYVYRQNMNKRMQVWHKPTDIVFNLVGNRTEISHIYDGYAFVLRNSAMAAYHTPQQALLGLIKKGYLFPQIGISGFLVYSDYHRSKVCSIRWSGGNLESTRLYDWTLQSMVESHIKGSKPPYIIITNPHGLECVSETYARSGLQVLKVPHNITF